MPGLQLRPQETDKEEKGHKYLCATKRVGMKNDTGTKLDKDKKKKRTGSVIDLNPTVPTHVSEEYNQNKLDRLIRLGLGDQQHLSYYRAAMNDPEGTVNSILYRPYVAKALDNLLDLIFDDPVTYNRIQMALQQKHGGKYVVTEETSPETVSVSYDRVLKALND